MWIGSPVTNEKPPNTFRVVFNNTNGFGSQRYGPFIQQLSESQTTLQVDFLGVTEHGLNSGQPRIRNNLHHHLKQHHLGKYYFQINSSNMETASAYLPGGTAILLLGPIIGRLEPSGNGGDPIGRWSYITLRRRKKPPLTVYIVYKVNVKPTNDVGITAWHQQRLHLDSQNRHKEHPRDAFTTDLIKDIKDKQTLGHDIIVGGDFNDTLYTPRSQLLKLATSTNLTDPWTRLYPGLEKFNTYQRGTRRIDSMLCSHSIVAHIQSIGYSPFNWLTTSDHRALVIDFNATALFGTTNETLAPPQMRGIKSNDKQKVENFIRTWHDHLKANDVFDRITKLQDPQTTHLEVEALDSLIGQGGDSAERQCQRRRMPLFSTRLAQLRALASITRGNYLSLKHGRHQTATFQERIDRHSLDLTLASDALSAHKQYQTVKQDLQLALQDNRELRIKEQNILIEQSKDYGRKDIAKIIANIKTHEARRKTWQMLRFVRKQDSTSQKVDRIDVPASWPPPTDIMPPLPTLEDPKSCTEWKTLTDPDDIEYYLRLRNRGHFGQAQGTPFTEPPISDSLNWQANGDLSEQILAGQHTITTNDVPQCQALLDACRTASDLDLLPAAISLLEFQGKIKSWRENTSTSPSGRHLGRYKSLFADGPPNTNPNESPADDEQPIQLHKAQQDIAKAIVAIINYCIKNGYILNRWKTIVTTMIFKESGNFKIHRLRIIHIYEADFNLLLAIKWRQLLHSADQREVLNPGLYGGRPGCEAQSLTFLEELKYDISYTTRRTLFNFDNDATSCYDRIIISLASMINRKYGLHRDVVLVHATTLQEARYHLRTPLGYSDKYYSHCIEYPIHGSGQGSGNSPSIWLFISSTLCDAHQRSAHGAKFISPDGTEETKITMVGFVDDSTGTCNDFRPQSQADIPTIASWMQQDAQIWNDLLWCSGGKLELPKCSVHTLYFSHQPNGRPKVVLEPIPTSIRITDAENGAQILIPSKRADQPHRTLGHWKSPADPKQTEQLKALSQKANSLAILISTGQLTRFGSTLAYHGVYIPCLKYVLPQCFFPAHALDRAERQSLQHIIAKCGFNRHTPTQLRYAPLTYAGCGFIRWSTLQGEGQIMLFLKHWRTQTIVSRILRVALAWSQFQSGLSKSILQDTRTNLPHLEGRWIKSLRTFLGKVNATIEVDKPYVVPPERERDIYIMEYAITSNLFDDNDLQIINYCRQYLHVTTVSELFDATGTTILQHSFECRRPPWFPKHQFIILQRRPSGYQIRHQWQRLCRTLSTHGGTAAAFLDFGSWTHKGIKLRTKREAYITTRQVVYQWIDSSYWMLQPLSRTVHSYRPIQATTWTPDDTSTPLSLIQTVEPSGSVFTITDSNTHHTSKRPQPIPILQEDFDDYLQHLPDWERQLLSNTQFEFGAFSMMGYLHDMLPTDAPIYEVSDGSMAQKTTSFGWMIGTEPGQRLAWCNGPGFGPATSHRAECWGKLSAARLLHHLQIFTGRPLPPNLKIKSCTDNQGLITSLIQRRTYSTPHPNTTLKPDWDLIEEIHTTYQQLNVESITFAWIKGHQDADTPYEQLHIGAQYNVDADRLADEYLAEHPYPRPISPLVPTSKCILKVRDNTIHGHYTTSIREAATLPGFFAYLKYKHRWTKQALNNIGWEWFKTAAKSYEHTDNHLMKLVHDQLPTNAKKSKQGGQPWLSSTCRHCNQEPETFEHLLRCNHPTGQEFRKDLPVSILSYCKRNNTPHNFNTTIVIALEDWVRARPPLEAIEASSPVHVLLHAQRGIGWNHFMKGFLSQQWQTYLEYEFNHNHEAPAPENFEYDRFFSGLIKKLWEQQTKFWFAYQQKLQQPSPTHKSSKQTEYESEIRHLFRYRKQVMPHHRDDYFPQNLTEFLHHSTPTQLQNYLNNYKPAIRRSIREAQKQAKRYKPIFHFPGFLRHRSPTTNLGITQTQPKLRGHNQASATYTTTSSSQRNTASATRSQTAAPTTGAHLPENDTPTTHMRERPPHKYSRWKPLLNIQSKLTTFFTHIRNPTNQQTKT